MKLKVNGEDVSAQQLIKDGDTLEVAGVKMSFSPRSEVSVARAPSPACDASAGDLLSLKEVMVTLSAAKRNPSMYLFSHSNHAIRSDF